MALNSIYDSAPAMLDWANAQPGVAEATSSARSTTSESHATLAHNAETTKPNIAIKQAQHNAESNTVSDRFVASVPSPPGTYATGPSMEVAEYNLRLKLDTIA